ncbi:hypothetical protein NFI96_001646 [Prochilodus magdalenae]|nr:hypothetical protein NFI96_001646 [Prochilodus magdalenae]
MATQQLDGVESMEREKSPHPGFSAHKYSLLVVVGEHSAAGFVEYLVSEIERGVSPEASDQATDAERHFSGGSDYLYSGGGGGSQGSPCLEHTLY